MQMLRVMSGNNRPIRAEGQIDRAWLGVRASGPPQVFVVNGQLCVVGEGIRAYRAATPTAPPQKIWEACEDLRVTQVVRTHGDRMIVLGSSADRSGYQAREVQNNGETSSFKIHLGSPPAAPPLVTPSGDDLWMLSSTGELFVCGIAELTDNSRTTAVARTQAHVDATEIPNHLPGISLWCDSSGFLGPLSGPDQLAAVRIVGEQPASEWVALPQSLACPPVTFGTQLLIAFKGGPLCLYDVKEEAYEQRPFLPDVMAENLPCWRTPAVLDDHRVVVSDGQSRLYLLRLREDGTGLELVKECDKAVRFSTGLVAVGNAVWGVDDHRQLQRVATADLTLEIESVLPAEVQWGPVRVGTQAYLASGDGQLHCLTEELGAAWTAQLAMAPVVGACQLDARHLAVASERGEIAVLDVRTGEMVNSPLATHQRLAFGPLSVRGQLLVLTQDGCLLALRPTVDELLQDRAASQPESDRE